VGISRGNSELAAVFATIGFGWLLLANFIINLIIGRFGTRIGMLFLVFWQLRFSPLRSSFFPGFRFDQLTGDDPESGSGVDVTGLSAVDGGARRSMDPTPQTLFSTPSKWQFNQ